jgi:hypothetical protein
MTEIEVTIEDELAQAMSKNLMEPAAEAEIHADDVTMAVSSLVKAADILDNIGDHEMAEKITKFLEYFSDNV